MAALLAPGTQVVLSRGLDLKTNTYRHTEPKRCGLCRAPSVFIDRDTHKHRVMSCDECTAVQVITKGNGSWWYHDAQLPDDMAPNFVRMIYADGDA